MITVDKRFIASFISKQSQTESELRSFNNGKFPCVSVVVSIMFDNYQKFFLKLGLYFSGNICKRVFNIPLLSPLKIAWYFFLVEVGNFLTKHNRRSQTLSTSPRRLRGRAFASHEEDRGSIPGRDRPNLLKQVVKARLPSARQQGRVSQRWSL